MTYCVALRLDRGLVFMSDTRTNASVDNVQTYRKMSSWTSPGERAIVMLSAGNLATTQAVVSLLNERARAAGPDEPSLMTAPTMFQLATQVGRTLREVIDSYARGDGNDSTFDATLIVGGQIKGMAPRVFMIYPEGNFIEAYDDTPFLQIGETKYGRPILVRAYDPAMTFEDAVKLLLVSFDSTAQANLSVGLPLDIQLYEADSFELAPRIRFTADDPYFTSISTGWGDALKRAFASLPDPPLSDR